jgi:hypothetical protein
MVGGTRLRNIAIASVCVVAAVLMTSCSSSNQSFQDGIKTEHAANYSFYTSAQAACTVAASYLPSSDNINQFMSGCESAWNAQHASSATGPAATPPTTSTTTTTAPSQCTPASLRPGSQCIGANLQGAGLDGANLTGANLSNTNLNDAELGNANLTNVNLSGADLSDAQLEGTTANPTILTGANLSGANLSGASLGGVDVSSANLTGVQWGPRTICPNDEPASNQGNTCANGLNAVTPP